MKKLIVLFLISSFSILALAQEPETQATADPNQPRWQKGPLTGQIGDIAQIKIPEGFLFGDVEMTEAFLQYTGNSVNGTELAIIAKDGANWFILFEFDDIGYVDDKDKDSLDADAILKSITEATKAASEARLKENPEYIPLYVDGWEVAPKYDEATNNLEWAVRAKAADRVTINHNIRILGRKGVMGVTLVSSTEELKMGMNDTRSLLNNYEFKTGSKYAEFMEGDKVAAYGLGALVMGGAGAALLKSGFFQKFWKLIVAGLVVAGGFLKKLFTGRLGEQKITRRRDDENERPS